MMDMINPVEIPTILDVADIWKARERIKPYVLRTPLLYSPSLSRKLGAQIYLKLECWQVCGCFKVRGAVNFVSSLSFEHRMRGLVTASSGNHGIGVAYAAALFGNLPGTVFLPENADTLRLDRIRSQGVKTVLTGSCFAEAYSAAQAFTQESGAVFVHSHADPRVIAGQGTIGLEILEDLPDVDLIVVPIGGGGLISGISLAVTAGSPRIRIMGVEPAAAPAAYLSMQDGHCRESIDVSPSMADGLLGGIGRLPFDIFRDRISGVELVAEEEIAAAMSALQKEEQLMVEPAAAVGLASLLNGKVKLNNNKVVLVITSRNINASRYNRILREYER